MRKEYLKVDNPKHFLKEQILRGDKGDGVPNFLSPSDTFVSGSRQVPLSRTKIVKWLDMSPEIFCNYEMMVGYKRNEEMVKLSSDIIPTAICSDIVDYHVNHEPKDRGLILPYFIENKLRLLTEKIEDF